METLQELARRLLKLTQALENTDGLGLYLTHKSPDGITETRNKLFQLLASTPQNLDVQQLNDLLSLNRPHIETVDNFRKAAFMILQLAPEKPDFNRSEIADGIKCRITTPEEVIKNNPILTPYFPVNSQTVLGGECLTLEQLQALRNRFGETFTLKDIKIFYEKSGMPWATAGWYEVLKLIEQETSSPTDTSKDNFNRAEIAQKVQEITILHPGSVERFRAHANQFHTEWQTYFEQKYKDIPATISDEEFDALRNDPQKMIADDTPDRAELKISLSEQYAALAVLHDTELSQYPAILEEKPTIFRLIFGQITGKNAYLRSYDDRFWGIALIAVETDLCSMGEAKTETTPEQDNFFAQQQMIKKAALQIHQWLLEPKTKAILAEFAQKTGDDYEKDPKGHCINYLTGTIPPQTAAEQLETDYLLLMACYQEWTDKESVHNQLTENWPIYLPMQAKMVLTNSSQDKQTRIEAALLNVEKDLATGSNALKAAQEKKPQSKMWKITSCHSQALEAFNEARKHVSGEDKKQLFEWILDNQPDGYTPPGYKTWKRYVNYALDMAKEYNKNPSGVKLPPRESSKSILKRGSNECDDLSEVTNQAGGI